MKLGVELNWETSVHASWRLSDDSCADAGSANWGILPELTSWRLATLQETDGPNLYVNGSGDWWQVFGSYSVPVIAKNLKDEDDLFAHSSRIRDMGQAYLDGVVFQPVVLVSFALEGPYVAIDGNHRLVALYQQGLLAGTKVIVGTDDRIGTSHALFREAVWSVDDYQ